MSRHRENKPFILCCALLVPAKKAIFDSRPAFSGSGPDSKPGFSSLHCTSRLCSQLAGTIKKDRNNNRTDQPPCGPGYQTPQRPKGARQQVSQCNSGTRSRQVVTIKHRISPAPLSTLSDISFIIKIKKPGGQSEGKESRQKARLHWVPLKIRSSGPAKS